MSATAPKHPWIGPVVLILICFAASGVGGAVTTYARDIICQPARARPRPTCSGVRRRHA
jgi:hypothetical protein